MASYKPTLLNVACSVLILYDNYTYWTAYARGEIYEYGGVALVISMLVALTGLLVDFILQKFVRNAWIVNGAESVVIAIFIFFYLV